MPDTKPVKRCASCGRSFSWRRKWAACWDEVRYCSERCRRHRPGRDDRRLERTIVELLAGRKGSICPSEAARSVSPDDWRGLMEASRAAGRRLAGQGIVEFTQRGRRVDPDTARGPVRLERGPKFPQRYNLADG